MKQKIDLLLYKSVLDSGFFSLKYNKKNSIENSANFFSLIKEFKQFLRILNFLKSRKKASLFLSLPVLEDKVFFDCYIKKLPAGIPIESVIENRLSFAKISSKRVNALITLSAPKTKNYVSNCKHSRINIPIIFDSSGFKLLRHSSYKILTELDSLNKKIFFLAMLEKSLKTKHGSQK